MNIPACIRLLFAGFVILTAFPQRASASCVTPSSTIAGWWRAEQNTSDTIGGINGTITNGVVYVPGKVGYAFLQTNGGAAITLGDPETLHITNLTIETWIRRYSTNIVSSETNNGLFFSYGTGGYGFGIQPNGLVFLTQVNYSQIPVSSATTPAIADTNWHHVAVTSTNGLVAIYIDGVSNWVASGYGPSYFFSTEAAVGARGDSQDCSFYGAIDELSVYTNVLTSNQIWGIYNAGTNGGFGKCVPSGAPDAPCAAAPTNMVTWWRGESNTLDSITGVAATFTNGATYTNVGAVDYSFSQAASGAAVIVGNPSYIQLQNLTIEGWIKLYSTTWMSSQHDNGLIFGYGSLGYAFALDTTGALFWTKVGINQTSVTGSTPRLTDTNWHHVAVTANGGVVWAYLDGAGTLLATNYSPGFSFTTNAAIGARGDSPYDCSFLGAIDELSIYNRALTSTEIASIFNNGAAGKCGPLITSEPASLAVNVGDTATFSVNASVSLPLSLTYQWYYNGAAISGATDSSYTIIGATPGNSGNYDVVISDFYASVVSTAASLTVPNDLGLRVFIDQPLGSSNVP